MTKHVYDQDLVGEDYMLPFFIDYYGNYSSFKDDITGEIFISNTTIDMYKDDFQTYTDHILLFKNIVPSKHKLVEGELVRTKLPNLYKDIAPIAADVLFSLSDMKNIYKIGNFFITRVKEGSVTTFTMYTILEDTGDIYIKEVSNSSIYNLSCNISIYYTICGLIRTYKIEPVNLTNSLLRRYMEYREYYPMVDKEYEYILYTLYSSPDYITFIQNNRNKDDKQLMDKSISYHSMGIIIPKLYYTNEFRTVILENSGKYYPLSIGIEANEISLYFKDDCKEKYLEYAKRLRDRNVYPLVDMDIELQRIFADKNKNYNLYKYIGRNKRDYKLFCWTIDGEENMRRDRLYSQSDVDTVSKYIANSNNAMEANILSKSNTTIFNKLYDL